MAVAEAVAAARPITRRVTLRLPQAPRRREALAILITVLTAVLVLAPLTLLWQIPQGYDTDAFYAPFGAFLHAQLSQGHLPLWNPHAFAGQPFAADPQSGVLYPPALLAYGLLDPAHALVALTTFHYLIAVVGAYAVARLVGANRLGSIYAGLAYGVSGQIFARVQALGLLSGAAWIPVCIAAALFVARRRARVGPELALMALALCLLALTGSQQITAVTGIACIIVLVVERGTRGGSSPARRRRRRRACGRRACFHASSSSGSRSRPMASSTCRRGHLVLSDVRTLFGPFGAKTSEVATVYAGALTPALALIALFRRPGVRRVPIALGAFGLVWAPGWPGRAGPVPLIRGSLPTSRSCASTRRARLAVLAGLSLGRRAAPLAAAPSRADLLLALICAPGSCSTRSSSSDRGRRSPTLLGRRRSGRYLRRPADRPRSPATSHGTTTRSTTPARRQRLAARVEGLPATPGDRAVPARSTCREGPSRFAWLTDGIRGSISSGTDVPSRAGAAAEHGRDALRPR